MNRLVVKVTQHKAVTPNSDQKYHCGHGVFPYFLPLPSKVGKSDKRMNESELVRVCVCMCAHMHTRQEEAMLSAELI